MSTHAALSTLPLRTLRWSLAALWLWTAVVSWLNADGISIALLAKVCSVVAQDMNGRSARINAP